jgi:hypothetical protein
LSAFVMYISSRVLTLEAAAVASSLVEGSHMLAHLVAVCCMHSWVERRTAVVERAGWGLRRLRVPKTRRLLLV